MNPEPLNKVQGVSEPTHIDKAQIKGEKQPPSNEPCYDQRQFRSSHRYGVEDELGNQICEGSHHLVDSFINAHSRTGKFEWWETSLVTFLRPSIRRLRTTRTGKVLTWLKINKAITEAGPSCSKARQTHFRGRDKHSWAGR